MVQRAAGRDLHVAGRRRRRRGSTLLCELRLRAARTAAPASHRPARGLAGQCALEKTQHPAHRRAAGLTSRISSSLGDAPAISASSCCRCVFESQMKARASSWRRSRASRRASAQAFLDQLTQSHRRRDQHRSRRTMRTEGLLTQSQHARAGTAERARRSCRRPTSELQRARRALLAHQNAGGGAQETGGGAGPPGAGREGRGSSRSPRSTSPSSSRTCRTSCARRFNSLLILSDSSSPATRAATSR